MANKKSFHIPNSEMQKLRVDLERYNNTIQKGIKSEIQRATLNIQTGAKQRVAVDTGTLRSRIETEIIHLGFTGRVIANTNYAEGLELGTRAHVIVPRRSKMLAWKARGSKTWILAKKVNHPGTRPKPFLGPALDHERPRFMRRVGKVIDKAK